MHLCICLLRAHIRLATLPPCSFDGGDYLRYSLLSISNNIEIDKRLEVCVCVILTLQFSIPIMVVGCIPSDTTVVIVSD